MTRITTALALALILSASSLADARTTGAAPQKEEGTVVLPAPSPNADEGCWQGYSRRFYIFSGGATSGPAGSVIEIDKKTWNGKFKLNVVEGATGAEDLDVHFFIDIGSIDPNDPAQQTVAQSSSYDTRAPGGEKGPIPELSEHAIICLVPGTGMNANWTYTGNEPKKKKG